MIITNADNCIDAISTDIAVFKNHSMYDRMLNGSVGNWRNHRRRCEKSSWLIRR